jgi:hypothetical protein
VFPVQCLQAGPSIRRPKDGHLRAFAGLEQPSPEPDQDHYRSDTGRQGDELWSERDHVARPFCAPRPIGPTIV